MAKRALVGIAVAIALVLALTIFVVDYRVAAFLGFFALGVAAMRSFAARRGSSKEALDDARKLLGSVLAGVSVATVIWMISFVAYREINIAACDAAAASSTSSEARIHFDDVKSRAWLARRLGSEDITSCPTEKEILARLR